MKTVIAFFMLVVFGCCGQDIPGITNRVTEIDRDKDGKVDVRIETAYRGRTKVMMTISHRNQQGTMAVQSRSYLVNGKLVTSESDEDGDGKLESITVFKPDTEGFGMFIRQTDGTVKPVSGEKLDSIRRRKAVADESLRKVLADPNMTREELGGVLEKNQQKIEAIKNAGKKDGD